MCLRSDLNFVIIQGEKRCDRSAR